MYIFQRTFWLMLSLNLWFIRKLHFCKLSSEEKPMRWTANNGFQSKENMKFFPWFSFFIIQWKNATGVKSMSTAQTIHTCVCVWRLCMLLKHLYINNFIMNINALSKMQRHTYAYWHIRGGDENFSAQSTSQISTFWNSCLASRELFNSTAYKSCHRYIWGDSSMCHVP